MIPDPQNYQRSNAYAAMHKSTTGQFLNEMKRLTQHHQEHCKEYQRIVERLFPASRHAESIEDLPYIPIGLFKRTTLASRWSGYEGETYKSSGTSGTRSSVFLDAHTTRVQSLALTSILRFWIGSERRPMIIVDSPSLLSGVDRFTARAAAVLGMMKFGRSHFWLLDDKGKPKLGELTRWLSEHSSKEIFVFGFTHMVWRAITEGVLDKQFDIKNATLIHGGGWKRLSFLGVSRDEFRLRVEQALRISRIHDYYGLVEQLGSIWVEESGGVFVPSIFSSALIRHPDSLSVLPYGQEGLVQLFSSLPWSYPGHSILTEDVGKLSLVDSPKIGGVVTGLELIGRLPKSDPRGCSDTGPERWNRA